MERHGINMVLLWDKYDGIMRAKWKNVSETYVRTVRKVREKYETSMGRIIFMRQVWVKYWTEELRAFFEQYEISIGAV